MENLITFRAYVATLAQRSQAEHKYPGVIEPDVVEHILHLSSINVSHNTNVPVLIKGESPPI